MKFETTALEEKLWKSDHKFTLFARRVLVVQLYME